MAPRFARWWSEGLLEAASQAASDYAPSVVYASLGPAETLEPALDLGERLNVPVVADLRDPWALDEVLPYPTRWHRRRDLDLMDRLFRRASLVIMNTPEAAQSVLATFPKLPASRVACLTNGYDEEDFKSVRTRTPDGRFRIVHAGYLHTELGLAHRRHPWLRRLAGGDAFKIDLLSRSHVYLLRALELLERETPGITDQIELRLIGTTSAADEAVVRASPIAKSVTFSGYRDHLACVHELVEADVLFLPLHRVEKGARARIVPGKTYEYLASGRPILAAVPPGDARDLVLSTGAGIVVEPDDVAGLAAAVRALMRSAPSPVRPRSEAIASFERKELTRRLAEHFHDVLNARSRAMVEVS
jgi:glycosyltransferase involved in cell wall biosynthesis